MHARVSCRCVRTGFFSGGTASLIVSKVQIWLCLRSDLKMTFFINAYCLWVFLVSGGRKGTFTKGILTKEIAMAKLGSRWSFSFCLPCLQTIYCSPYLLPTSPSIKSWENSFKLLHSNDKWLGRPWSKMVKGQKDLGSNPGSARYRGIFPHTTSTFRASVS